MRDVAIKSIVKNLQERGVDLSNMIALDFFSREGDWQTSYYAKIVSKIHAWEIDPDFESSLRRNLPENAEIKIGNSYEHARDCREKFNLIVLDNPQGCFGNDYCEHFEALPAVLPLAKEDFILIFNVKTKPFNYEDKVVWKEKRNKFYETDATELKEEFVYKYYKDYFQKRGFEVEFSFLTKRPQEEGLSAYTAKLTRRR